MKLKKIANRYLKELKEELKDKEISEITFKVSEDLFKFVKKEYLNILKEEYRDFIDNEFDDDLPLAASVNKYKNFISEETTALSDLPENVKIAFRQLKEDIRKKVQKTKSPVSLEELKVFPEAKFKKIFEGVVENDKQLRRLRSSLTGFTNTVTGEKFERVVKEQIKKMNRGPIGGLTEFLENNIDPDNINNIEVEIPPLKINMFDIEISINDIELFRIHCKLFTKKNKSVAIGINRNFEIKKEDYVKNILSDIDTIDNVNDYYRKTPKMIYIKMRELLDDLNEKEILKNIKPIFNLLGILQGKDIYVIGSQTKVPINDIEKVEKDGNKVYFLNDKGSSLFRITGHQLRFK